MVELSTTLSRNLYPNTSTVGILLEKQSTEVPNNKRISEVGSGGETSAKRSRSAEGATPSRRSRSAEGATPSKRSRSVEGATPSKRSRSVEGVTPSKRSRSEHVCAIES